jgi:hypothetical protein
MLQVIECNCEALNSNPSTSKKKKYIYIWYNLKEDISNT